VVVSDTSSQRTKKTHVKRGAIVLPLCVCVCVCVKHDQRITVFGLFFWCFLPGKRAEKVISNTGAMQSNEYLAFATPKGLAFRDACSP
jgi:hypothetical protein